MLVTAQAENQMKQPAPAALPNALRKACGFPSMRSLLAAMPLRQSLATYSEKRGKPEAFRKEDGKAKGPFCSLAVSIDSYDPRRQCRSRCDDGIASEMRRRTP